MYFSQPSREGSDGFNTVYAGTEPTVSIDL